MSPARRGSGVAVRDSPRRGLACRSQEQAGPAGTLSHLAVRKRPKKSQDLINGAELSRSDLKSPSVYAKKMRSLGNGRRHWREERAWDQRTPDVAVGPVQ